MVVKYERIGTSITGFTQNSVYIIVVGDSTSARLLSDDEVRTVSWSDLNNPSLWALQSIETVGTVQLFP